MLEIFQIPVLSDNYIYVLHESVSDETAVVDPALSEPVIALLKKKAWKLNYIFNTHHHDDHIGGNRQLKQQTGCQVIAAAADRQRIPGIDIEINDGDQIKLGNQTLDIIATPGHTLGHLVYYCRSSKALFCGDTLFSMGCGRLFEGSAAQMWQSLQKLKSLPAETRIYCAHEYTQTNGRFALTLEADNRHLQMRMQQVDSLRRQNLSTIPSTIELELATNPFFRERSPAIRSTLAMPDTESDIDIFSRIRQLKDQFH